MRLWLAIILVVLCAGSARAATITFETSPSGADVFMGDRRLGRSGEPVKVEIPKDDRARVTLRFEKEGHEPALVQVPAYALRGIERYPPPPLPAVVLKPTGIALRTYGPLAGLALVLMVGAFAWTRRVRTAKHALVAEEPVTRDRVNTTVGGYALVTRLGVGATAEVYQGVKLDSPDAPEVAVKVLRFGDESQAEQARLRFTRQAELLKGLSHPNIVRVVEWGQDGEALYMVEELASGGELAVPPSGLPVRGFLRVFAPIVDAMAYAHERGVVHRDLKPQNVLLTARGEPKVSDFGLALAAVETGQTSSRAGTPLYMAPEQMAGKPASPASDQYALGVMAYQLLTGYPPHEGETVPELMRKRQTPPAALEGVPQGLASLVARMLAMEPGDRYASLRDVQTELRQIRP